MKKMKVKKEIELSIYEDKNNIVVKDLQTLSLVMGSSAAGNNLHMYGITKVNNEWLIPKQTIRDRITYIEDKRDKLEASLKIMYQLI